ncbi:MAG: ABC transporter ATP-binding protein, partial [Oligoflexia bacterium]|nr:ABC transporter ATP-binding protein [Oligoflexia bacterium]
MKITLTQIGKAYRDANKRLTVIEGLSYQFPAQGSVAIIGRSGIGKSTLLHLIGGLDLPSTGAISFDQQRLDAMSLDQLSAFRGKHIGFVFQSHHLLPEFSALENVAMPLVIMGEDSEAAEERAEDLLERVGLSERMHHRPAELSGGEQQRVAIARAVVAGPDVVLADEPTGNLDPVNAQGVQDLLLEVNRELNNVLIVVSHSRELAAAMDIVQI